MSYQRVSEFDTWRPGYGAATVRVYIAGTTTLASLFSDTGLTVAVANPQTLSTKTVNGITYGKFSVPIYTSSDYTADIDSADQTGVSRVPVVSLADQDASNAEVTPTGRSVATDLDDMFARVVHAEDYGALDATDTATNTTTLTVAIGAVASNSGGCVLLPAGTFPFTQLTLPEGVVLCGAGRGATTLQSQTGANVVTIGGDRAGFSDLTLDGVNLTALSVGVYSKANDETYFRDVDVKRFETGIHYRGGRRANWSDLYVTNCGTGTKLHGDNDATGGADGDEYRNNRWTGGRVSQCSTRGIDLSYEDKKVFHNQFVDIGFEDNTGTALNINGARYAGFPGCWWTGNTVNIAVDDDDDTDNALENTVLGVRFPDCDLSAGTMTFTGECQDIAFQRSEFSGVAVTLTQPKYAVLAQDCIEDVLTTISGDGEKWTRNNIVDRGASSGITTDATPLSAWELELSPGQVCYLEGKVLGNQKNGVSTAEYHIAVSAHRPGSTLAYNTQTADFTVGDTLTGGTSGATALIIADSDSGATGTLTLRSISGVFENGEPITDVGGGVAVVNGTISDQNAALLGSVASVRATREDVAGWAAVFAASAGRIELQVTGAASTTIEWVADVDVTLT